MVWKEAKLKTLSVEDHHQDRRQLASALSQYYDVRLAGRFLVIKGGKPADRTGTK
jgi:hypothetical protein